MREAFQETHRKMRAAEEKERAAREDSSNEQAVREQAEVNKAPSESQRPQPTPGAAPNGKSSQTNALAGWGARKQPQGRAGIGLSNRATETSQAQTPAQDTGDEVIEVSASGTSKNAPRVEVDASSSIARGEPGASRIARAGPAASVSKALVPGVSTKASIPSKRKLQVDSDAPDSNSIGRIPKKARAPMASPQSPRSPAGEEGLVVQDRKLGPEWYQALKKNNKRGRDSGGAERLLLALKEHITRAKKQREKNEDTQETQNRARQTLHRLAFEEVDEMLLRNNNMLHGEYGIAQIFDTQFSGEVPWAYDIKSDAEELYNKWCRRDFDTHLMRGIQVGTTSNGGSDKIVPNYDKKLNAHFHGNGHLLNGQW